MKIVTHTVDPHSLIMADVAPKLELENKFLKNRSLINRGGIEFKGPWGTDSTIDLSQTFELWNKHVNRYARTSFELGKDIATIEADLRDNFSIRQTNYLLKRRAVWDHMYSSTLTIAMYLPIEHVDEYGLQSASVYRAELENHAMAETLSENEKSVFEAIQDPNMWINFKDVAAEYEAKLKQDLISKKISEREKKFFDALQNPAIRNCFSETGLGLIDIEALKNSLPLAVNKLASYTPISELVVCIDAMNFSQQGNPINKNFFNVCRHILKEANELDQALDKVLREYPNPNQVELIKYVFTHEFGSLRYINDDPSVSQSTKNFTHNLLVNSKDIMCHFNKLGLACDSSVMDAGGGLVKCNDRGYYESKWIAEDCKYIEFLKKTNKPIPQLVPGEILQCNFNLLSKLDSDSCDFFNRRLKVPYNIYEVTDMDYRALACERSMRFRVITSLILNPQ